MKPSKIHRELLRPPEKTHSTAKLSQPLSPDLKDSNEEISHLNAW
jgi:hypothetical protein